MKSTESSPDKNATRLNLRKPVNLDVDLHFLGHEYTGCRTRDIGLGGLFVEFRDADIPNSAMVDIIVRIFKDGSKKCHRFHATVAHASSGGYGLAFQNFDDESNRAVQDILQLKSLDEVIH